jgi:hypothetical protein
MPRARPAPTSGRLWRLGPVTVGGDARPLEHISLFLPGWDLREIGEGPDAPDIEIATTPNGYILNAHGAGPAMRSGGDPLDAANALAGAAIASYVARDRRLFCLHGGAVRLAKGVVALAGDSGAGKSSVAMLLAARGHRLFGDDRVALAPPAEAVALGLAPKLRWPLPPGAGASFSRYVDERAAWWGEDAVYLHLRPGEAAALGEHAPLAAVVGLARDGVDEDLAAMPPAAAVRALLPHCFAPHLGAERLVAVVAATARHVPVVRLSYRNSTAAANLLDKAYG